MIKRFTELFEVLSQPGNVKANCNTFTVVNSGVTIISLNGYDLGPGDQYTSPGNIDELNESIYTIAFPAATGTYILIRKSYSDASYSR